MYRRTISLCMFALMSARNASADVLSRADLLHKVVGNTIVYPGESEQVFEYLDPSGEIRAESTVHGKFSAHWRFLDDQTLCFESADPMASGCVSVLLAGGKVAFVRRDGVIEGPFELLTGNPRGL